MNYLTRQEIIDINKDIIPASTIINNGALDAAALMPGRVMFGVELHKSLGQKAAALVYPIAQNHPFNDGNKRTAYQALRAFLGMNNYTIIEGREATVQGFIGRCADEVPIEQEELAGRLQMQFLKNGALFVGV